MSILDLIKETARLRILRPTENILLEKTLSGTVFSSDSKGPRHFLKYVVPHLSAAGIRRSAKNILATNAPMSDKMKERLTSAKETKKAGRSHETADGRKVVISHVEVHNKQLHAITTKGEKIPFSQIIAPEKFRTANRTANASKVETKIVDHIGGVAAGNNKHAEADVLVNTKRGKFKLESKTTNAKFGQLSIEHDGKSWKFRGHPHLVAAATRATIDGVPVLEHLNTHHRSGRLSKTISAKSARGSTRAYMRANGANAIHIHDLGSGVGSTYTVGGRHAHEHPFHGTGLAHLSDSHLDSLDHQMKIEPGGSVIFRPKRSKLRELANASKQGYSMNLHDKKHGTSWIKGVR